jgi:pyrophosphatase PpaX
MKFTHILFDLDGTLVDTNELILQSFEHALGHFFPGRYTRQDVLPYMGEPLVQQFSRFTEPELVPQLVDVYRKHNVEKHDLLVAIFPHVKEVLTDLKNTGHKLAVVTNKMRLTAEMGLRLFELEPLIDVLVTIEDTTKHKPEPEPLLFAMDKLGAEAEAALMVGDSPYDIMAGKAAGTATCGVSWSLRGKEGLIEYQPDYLIDDMKELLKIVRG